MHVFEILPHTADIRVKAIGSTRAGLLTAAVEGVFRAAGPRSDERAEEVERPFKIAAADFSSLLVHLLNEAISSSVTHHETVVTVRFTLITDTKAEGAFVGRAVTGFEKRITAATRHERSVEKNADGNWEATIVLA